MFLKQIRTLTIVLVFILLISLPSASFAQAQNADPAAIQTASAAMPEPKESAVTTEAPSVQPPVESKQTTMPEAVQQAENNASSLRLQFQSTLAQVKKLVPGKNYIADEALIEAPTVFVAKTEAAKIGATVKFFSADGYAVLKLGKGSTLVSVLTQNVKSTILTTALYPNQLNKTEDTSIQSKGDPNLCMQYCHDDMGNKSAWKISKGSAKVLVAVLDTGVVTNHPEFKDRLSPLSYNAYSRKKGIKYVSDDVGHGTHVAGIIAADQNNGHGGSGTAPSIKLMVIKANIPNTGYFSAASELEGIYYAAKNGAKVLNMSIARSYYDGANALEQKAIQYAISKGVVVVCAAGNDAEPHAGYPAAYPECIAVSATSCGNVFDGSYSNWGPEIDLAAPGTDVYSTYLAPGYEFLSGTSMASPQVAGVAALIRSYYPKYSVNQVKAKLFGTATDKSTPGYDVCYGYGVVNSYHSLVQYTVKFNSKGGSTVASTKAGYNAPASAPKNPTLKNYHFIGWYTNSACTVPWNFATPLKSNISLYAKWVSHNLKVSFNSMGGTAVAARPTTFGSRITTPAAPARSGYTFGGWFYNAACTQAWNFNADTVRDNITLYAKWILKTFTVMFNTQGGSSIPAVNVRQYAAFSAPAAPTRTDFAFSGWYKEPACVNAWNFSYTANSNITLYAKWVRVSCTVKFDTQGGSAIAPVHVKIGQTISAPEPPKLGNHIFLGWYKYADCVLPWNFSTDLASTDITLYAKWKDDQFHPMALGSIPFDASGMAIDSKGQIYITDTYKNSVYIYNASGTLVSEWPDLPKESFIDSGYNPSGIAIDSSDNAYITFSGGAYVFKYDSTGKLLYYYYDHRFDYSFPVMDAVAPAANGDLYCLCGDVVEFAPGGAESAVWRPYYGGVDLALSPAGDVYVLNYKGIFIYSGSGKYKGSIGSEGSGDGQIGDPEHMAIDADGNIYVTDTENHRVQKFSSDGKLLEIWNSDGSGDNQFIYPSDITIGKDGTVYVLDNGNNRIMVKKP